MLCKAEQIHKMTTIFIQNDKNVHPGQFLVQLSEFAQLYIPAGDKSRDPTVN